MAKDPMKLQKLLERLLNSRDVYSKPPSSNKLGYPCIIFQKDGENVKFADDSRFVYYNRYSLIVVSREATPKVCDDIANLPLCSFLKRYVADNLYHNVYQLYW